VQVLFSGELWLSYGQFHLWGEDPPRNPDLSFGGQRNGLLGAAHPGALAMRVGLHTGDVPLTVELHPAAPALDLSWEEVVEATWPRYPDSPTECLLMGQMANTGHSMVIPPVELRVRFSASGMDAAHRADTRSADEPVVDRYLLQLWPATPGGSTADAVLEQTSDMAAYWHRVVRELPPATPPRSRAEHTEQAQLEGQRLRAEARELTRRLRDRRMPGGPRAAPPSG
jgi:hypothetical protein